MLQNLLVERFRFHYEPRELDIYDLKVAKGGPKMQLANAEGKTDANAPPKVSFAADGLPSSEQRLSCPGDRPGFSAHHPYSATRSAWTQGGAT